MKNYKNKCTYFWLNSRTDIIEDTGSSLSPEIDIGQIEGAFTFGLGLWTSEEIKFHPLTGKILTYDTWVSFYLSIHLRYFITRIFPRRECFC